MYENEQLAEMYKEARQLIGAHPPGRSTWPEERKQRARGCRWREWREIVVFVSVALSSAALVGILLQLTLKNAGLL